MNHTLNLHISIQIKLCKYTYRPTYCITVSPINQLSLSSHLRHYLRPFARLRSVSQKHPVSRIILSHLVFPFSIPFLTLLFYRFPFHCFGFASFPSSFTNISFPTALQIPHSLPTIILPAFLLPSLFTSNTLLHLVLPLQIQLLS